MNRSSVVYLTLCLLLGLFACDNTAKTDDSTGEQGAISAPQSPYENINVSDFQQKMKSGETVVLDVRTPPEVQAGMIDGAISIDFMASNFREKIAELDKNKTYLVYCQSGGRSARACEMMSEMGFKSLYNLKEGYMEWSE